MRTSATVNYFTDLSASQSYNNDVTDSTRSLRTIGANVAKSWSVYNVSASFSRSEYFSSATASSRTGSTPIVSLTGTEKPIFDGLPLYFSMKAEFAHLEQGSTADSVETARSTTRFDVMPQVRIPFRKWQWLTVSTSAALRDT